MAPLVAMVRYDLLERIGDRSAGKAMRASGSKPTIACGML
jgi:hypothetical protein